MKRSSLSLGRLDLSSRYFLKRSKIDISQNTRNFFRDALSAARQMRRALQSPRSVEKSEQFELLHQIVFEDEIHPLAIMRCFVTETATVQPSWFLLANAR